MMHTDTLIDIDLREYSRPQAEQSLAIEGQEDSEDVRIPELDHIISEVKEKDHRELAMICEREQLSKLSIKSTHDEDAASIQVIIVITKTDDTNLCTVRCRATIHNPMEFLYHVIDVFAPFALCVAATSANNVGQVLYGCYNESKEAAEDMDKINRCKDVYSQFKNKKGVLKNSVISGMISCTAIKAV